MSKLLSNTTLLLNIDWGKVADFLFVDKDGKFQWIGVSAVLAVVVFLFNTGWEHHKLNADIKSKSRIQWMNTVREYMVNYIISARDLDLALRKELSFKARYKKDSNGVLTDKSGNQITDQKHSEIHAENYDAVNLSVRKLSKNYDLLMLYIPNSKSNKDLVNSIQNVSGFLNSVRSKVNKYKVGQDIGGKTVKEYKNFLSSENSRKIKAMKDIARNYMKIEWERAKKGK